MSAINPIHANASTSATDSTSAAVLPTQTLTQADFLKLLVAQMSAQDPMNPQSNTDFAAQMAQFSALQTSQSTETDIQQLNANQQVQEANDLLGQTVTVSNGKNPNVTGAVSAVDLSGTTPTLTINGTAYNLSQVLSVQTVATTTQP